MKAKTLLLAATLIWSLCLTATPQTRTAPRRASRSAVRTTSLASAVRTPSGIELVPIPAGSFLMGSATSEDDFEEGDERPVHRVRFKYSFYMGKYEVTQAQWRAVMGKNPPSFTGDEPSFIGDDLPVLRVRWHGAQEFIRRLNAKNDGYIYRLPSEAEWEYACRAGTTTDFAFGSSLSSDLANFDGNQPFGGAPKGVSRGQPTPVGSFIPNAWGLYDMHGNVFEWCEDAYHDSYDGAPSDGSAWIQGGVSEWRVLRGGSFEDDANALRSPSRERLYLDICDENIGMRLVAVTRR